MSDLVTVDINANGVADVRLNRPDKYNALSAEMFDAIAEAGETLMDDKSVRAVVLSGDGRWWRQRHHVCVPSSKMGHIGGSV